MSKELEALETIKIKCHPNSNPSPIVDEALEIVEQALQRLEAIENASPSEALKCVDILKEDGCIITLTQGKALETIRQALLKAQEQENENAKLKGQVKYLTEVGTEFQKVLEIMFEKNVDIIMIRMSETLDKYNRMIYKDNFNRKELTQEEFYLLKRYLENE